MLKKRCWKDTKENAEQKYSKEMLKKGCWKRDTKKDTKKVYWKKDAACHIWII